MGYFSATIKGFSWITILRVFSRGFVMVRIAILARIFSPDEFGVFGIAALVLAFFEVLTETGIVVYIIQGKKDIKQYINEAWVISILRGAIIALFILVSARFVSNFFNSKDAFSLLLLASLVPLLRGFINPSIVLFQKELEFRKEFFLRISLLLFESIIILVLAFIKRDISAFIWGFIFSAAFEVILSFILASPRPRFKIKREVIEDIFKRGRWVTFFGIFAYVAKEGDNAIVGKLLGTYSLGIYQMAYKISTLIITEVTDVVSKVTFPVFVKIADDKERLSKAYFKSTVGIVLLVLFLGIPILFFTKELVLLVFGSKWLEIVGIVKILTIYSIIRAISGYAVTLFLSVTKQNFAAIITFTRLLAMMICIVPLTLSFGTTGTAIAVLISALIELPVIIFLLRRVLTKTTGQTIPSQ